MAKKNYLPSANEFTPNQIDLQFCLKTADTSSTREEFLSAVRNEYFLKNALSRNDPVERGEQQLKLAGNVLIGLRNYKLLEEKEIALTSVGLEILNDPKSEKIILLKHLFEELCGYEIIKAVQSLKAKGVSPRTKKLLSEELALLGLRTKQEKEISANTTDHTKFIRWLEYCDLYDTQMVLDEEKFVAVVGRPSGLVNELWNLSSQQHLFLKYAWQVSSDGIEEHLVKNLKSGAEEMFGKFIERPDQIANDILYPLEKLGFFEIVRSSQGRGGNSGSIRYRQKIFLLTPADFVEGAQEKSPHIQIKKPIEQIFGELESQDISVKGIALEELAISIGQALGLRFVEFRAQGATTGGAEVDVIFEQLGLSYSKWLIQCKNTPKDKVHVSAVAKEVGNAVIHHANIVLLITTGGFTTAAQEYAKQTIAQSNIQVILVDGSEIAKFRTNGVSSLSRFFERQSEKIALERQRQK